MVLVASLQRLRSKTAESETLRGQEPPETAARSGQLHPEILVTSRNMGYNYSYPTYNSHEPRSRPMEKPASKESPSQDAESPGPGAALSFHRAQGV